MKMLMLVYSGTSPQRISSMLDEHHAGYTELAHAHGAGSTARHAGDRVWPGEATLFVSIVPEARADELVTALQGRARQLPEGERLHVAVLQTETFF
jgi:hypothetical protein